MLNKKAIAAFAAGATLLSGLAVAAPALAENAAAGNAPAATAQKDDAAKQAEIAKLNQQIENAKKAQKAAQDKANDLKKDHSAEHALNKLQNALDEANDKLAEKQEALTKQQKVVSDYKAAKDAETDAKDAESDAVAAVNKLLTNEVASATYDLLKSKTSADAPKDKADAFNAAMADLQNKHAALLNATAKVPAGAAPTTTAEETAVEGAKKGVKDAQKKVNECKSADGVYGKHEAAVQAAEDEAAVQQTLIDSYTVKLAGLTGTPETPKKEDPKKEDPKKEDPKKEDPKKEDPKKTDPKKEEPAKDVAVPKKAEELKAYVEQVKAALKAEKDAKKAEAVKAALAEFGKAAKALKANKKDKAAQAAFAAALKKLATLVPYTAAKKPEPKPEPKPTEPSLVDPKATDLLYTNYQGLFADLAARGVTNVAAYDALLDKLQFGLKQTGWENILKNFGGNNCAYLNGLRRQLQKAVLHYGHVEAAVKDMVAELNEDFKDAQAHHDWDAAKVIDQKLGQAAGLLKIADNNRTRAAALLDSANDHAKDLSCDTGAKEVRDAMDKEPNSPFKPAPAPKPAPKTPKAPKLPNTGAVVALAAVAASVLAGMGAALRKIRH